MSASERRIAELEQRNRELEQRNRELEHLIGRHLRSDDLQMESGVSSRTREPFVHLRWGDQAGQLTPDAARVHALAIVDCAAAAEHDALLLDALVEEMGLEYERAVRLLGLMRERRGGTREASATAQGPEPER